MHKVFRYACTKKIWHIKIILVNAKNIDMSYLYTYKILILFIMIMWKIYIIIVFRADTLVELDDKIVCNCPSELKGNRITAGLMG